MGVRLTTVVVLKMFRELQIAFQIMFIIINKMYRNRNRHDSLMQSVGKRTVAELEREFLRVGRRNRNMCSFKILLHKLH